MLGQGSISKSVTFSQGAIVTIGFLVTGVAIAKAPIVAWVFLGALTGLLMFQLPIYAWLCSAVLAATLSRWFVATGFIPPILNFFHFPLALGAAFVATTGDPSPFSMARSIAIGLAAFFFLSFVSWAFNGGEFLRPPLNWLVFLEPFLIVYALVNKHVALCQFS